MGSFSSKSSASNLILDEQGEIIGSQDTAFSSKQARENYLKGVPVLDAKTGQELGGNMSVQAQKVARGMVGAALQNEEVENKVLQLTAQEQLEERRRLSVEAGQTDVASANRMARPIESSQAKIRPAKFK